MDDRTVVKKAKGTEEASTASGGEPQRPDLDAVELRAPTALSEGDLDAREAAISKTRKPMGPPLNGAPENDARSDDKEEGSTEPKGPPNEA